MSKTPNETTSTSVLATDNDTNSTLAEVTPNPYNVAIGKLLKLTGKIDDYTSALVKPNSNSLFDSITGLITKANMTELSLEEIIQKNEPSMSPVGAFAIATIACSTLHIRSRTIDIQKIFNKTIVEDKFHQDLLKHSLQVCKPIDAFESINKVTVTDVDEAFAQMSSLIEQHPDFN